MKKMKTVLKYDTIYSIESSVELFCVVICTHHFLVEDMTAFRVTSRARPTLVACCIKGSLEPPPKHAPCHGRRVTPASSSGRPGRKEGRGCRWPGGPGSGQCGERHEGRHRQAEGADHVHIRRAGDEFLLTGCPYLRKVINATRNINRSRNAKTTRNVWQRVVFTFISIVDATALPSKDL